MVEEHLYNRTFVRPSEWTDANIVRLSQQKKIDVFYSLYPSIQNILSRLCRGGLCRLPGG